MASTRSQVELENLGIGDPISRTVEEVSKFKKCFSMAVDKVNFTPQKQKRKFKEKADKLKFKLSQVSNKW